MIEVREGVIVPAQFDQGGRPSFPQEDIVRVTMDEYSEILGGGLEAACSQQGPGSIFVGLFLVRVEGEDLFEASDRTFPVVGATT